MPAMSPGNASHVGERIVGGFGDDSTMRRSMTAPALINQPLKVELPPWLGFDTPRQARSRRASGDYKGTPENPGQELQALMAVLAKRKEASAHAGTAYRQAQQQRKQQQTERAPADQARERGVRPNHVSPLGERHAYARRDATPARCPSVGVQQQHAPLVPAWAQEPQSREAELEDCADGPEAAALKVFTLKRLITCDNCQQHCTSYNHSAAGVFCSGECMWSFAFRGPARHEQSMEYA
mmetsp:Transcript_36616/g.62869  ORF Transcript_36616/g.62869 Transcript_36616/m.62869 type:complete len:239 (-) Transcript_36616:64-780(-)